MFTIVLSTKYALGKDFDDEKPWESSLLLSVSSETGLVKSSTWESGTIISLGKTGGDKNKTKVKYFGSKKPSNAVLIIHSQQKFTRTWKPHMWL